MPVSFWARTDSPTANNADLNLTGDPSVLITFVPSGTDGDIILEGGGSPDPDTEVQIDGVNYSFTFEFVATSPSAANQGGNQYPPELRDQEIILITVIDYPSPGETTRLAFLPDADATQAQMDSIGNGANRPQNIDTTGPGVVCFAEGTLLRTPDGERAVEDLCVGDLVTTLDDGPMPVVWIAKTAHAWPGSDEAALPIMIARNALAEHRPSRDLVLSPQHKVLMEETTDAAGLLAPAKGLTGLAGIRVMRGKKRVTYYHILLERHAILFSEGLATESFFPGPMALRLLGPANRMSLAVALDGLPSPYPTPARPGLNYAEARALVRQIQARRTLVMAAE